MNQILHFLSLTDAVKTCAASGARWMASLRAPCQTHRATAPCKKRMAFGAEDAWRAERRHPPVRLVAIILASLAPLAGAQVPGALPEDAAKLKASYQQGAEKAVVPLRERYLADLQRVMDATTRAGKLDGAAAVKQEIAAVTPGTAPAPAPAVPVKLPDEAARLQRAYQMAVKQAIEPLRQRYLTDLKRVLDQTSRAGKLEDALAIKTEVDAASAGTASATDTPGEFERRLIGTTWMWSNAFKFTFAAEGKTSGERKFTWKTVKPFTIEYQFGDGYHGSIVFERGLTRAAINEITPDGKKKTLNMPRAKE